MSLDYQERILAVMKEQGHTKASLAQGIGKGKATIGRYLASGDNRTYPGIEELDEIAQFLGVETHWLCFGIGDRDTPSDQLNNLTQAEAGLINVYSRSEVVKYLNGEPAQAYGQMPVEKKHLDKFAVVYPITGPLASRWENHAMIDPSRQWENGDLVLASIGTNPVVDFFTLVQTGDTIHVWYGDDMTKPLMHTVTNDEIHIIGVATWGTWVKR